MPDAIRALLLLATAPAERLRRTAYNVTAFSVSAATIAELVAELFPGAQIQFRPDPRRQAIVDTWPADIDDSAARSDWGWAPEYDLQRTFTEYLAPNIARRYRLDC
jgi:threonine 3-dehydrogenase